MEGYRRKPRRDTAHVRVWGYKTEAKRKDRNEGQASAKKQGERGGTLRYIRLVKRKETNENVFARPNGLRRKL